MVYGRCALSDTRDTGEGRTPRSTRDRVLEAALVCLVRNGYGGTTARAIAQAGGFAPGVIYYHFADLDDLLVAALERTSGARIDRYRAELSGIDRAVPAIARLRELYDEDTETGHIAAVQELYAGARPGTRLAAQLALETRKWEDLAEEQLTVLLRGKPLASVVRVRVPGLQLIAVLDVRNKPVVALLVADVEQDHDAGGHADRQAGDVDDRIGLALG